MYQQARYTQTRPPSLQNDPTSLIDSIRKHLTTKSIAIKTPLQLFNELFINNQRLNSSTLTKNRIELIDKILFLYVLQLWINNFGVLVQLKMLLKMMHVNKQLKLYVMFRFVKPKVIK